MLRKSIFPSMIQRAVRILFVGYAPQRTCSQDSRSVVTINDSEVLDQFIDSLMTKKSNKWKSWNDAKYKSNEVSTQPLNRDPNSETTPNLTCSSVDDYVCKNLSSSNLESILSVCCVKGVSPSPETLIKVAYVFAKAGNKSGIEAIISLADVDDRWNDIRKEELTVFKAEAIWRDGGSVQKSLEIICNTYKYQPCLRRFLRSSLRDVIGEVLQRRGEASLVQVKSLVLELADPPYEDAIPVSFLWGSCILSDWFADQLLSEELVHLFKDNPKFIKALQNRLAAIIGLALSKHQVDAIYRILETLLKLSLDKEAQAVLGKLFDYKYVMGDRRGCEAILQMCASTDLDIGSTRRKQFENAPTIRFNGGMTSKNRSAKSLDSPKKFQAPKFQFKY